MYEIILKNETKALITPNDLWLAEHLAMDMRATEIAKLGKINKRTLDARLDKLRLKCDCKTLWGVLVLLFKNGLIK